MQLPPRKAPRYSRILMVAAVGLGLAVRADSTAEFEKANRLYEQGLHAEAAAAYAQLLERSEISPAHYFNLGNALFRSGQAGQAIYFYRRAQHLAPRDPDIQANLQFVRNTVPGATSRREPAWRRHLSRMTLNEWTLWTALGLWIWMTLLTLRQWQPARTGWLRWPSWIAGGATGLACLCTTLLWHSLSFSATAIVIVPETALRYGPYEDSPSHHVVRDGTELRVLEAKDDWIGVAHPAQRVVWLKRHHALLFP